MKLIALASSILLVASACAFGSGGPGPLLASPLLFKTKEGFVEIRDGHYLRMDAIDSIEGRIVISYNIDQKKAPPHVFPLSSESLKYIPTIKKTADSTGKIDHIEAKIEIVVNGVAYEVATTGQRSPFEDMDRFEKTVVAARSHLEKFLTVLQADGRDSAKEPSEIPNSKPAD